MPMLTRMPASRVLDRRTALRGRVFEVEVERVELPDGRRTELEILRHPGASAIVPITEDGQVVLIRQYRHAAGDYLWEIPAGTRDGNEDFLTCAQRELTEETGYTASTWVDLGEMLPAPGYASERIRLYLARDLARVARSPDADEVITEVAALPAAEVLRWVADGSLLDAKTTVAVCRAHQRGLLATGASR